MADDQKEMRDLARSVAFKLGARPDPKVYTDTCRVCGEPCKPQDRGECFSCWRERKL